MMCAMTARLFLTIALVLGLLVTVPGAEAAPYPPTFALHPEFTAAAVRSDGSILAILKREKEQSSETRPRVSRYLPDGRLDRSFRPDRAAWAEAEAVTATDSKGRTLRSSRFSEGGIERLNPNGSVETSFAPPERELPAGEQEGPEFRVEAILPLPSGKVAVAGRGIGRRVRSEEGAVVGNSGPEVGVAVYDESGLLDPSFGTAGTLRLGEETGVEGEGFVGLTQGPGEAILVSFDGKPWSWKGAVPVVGEGSRVVALDPHGALDQSFATGGVFSSPDRVVAIEGMPDGGLLLAGTRWGGALFGNQHARGGDVFLERLTPLGVPDPTYGESEGRTTVDLSGIDAAHALLLRPDGSALVGGGTTEPSSRCVLYEAQLCTETPVLAAFKKDGRVDCGFGEDGVLRLVSLTWDSANFIRTVPTEPRGVLFLRELPGGRILAGGATEGVAFLAALTRNGRLDGSFGEDGDVTVTYPRRSSTELTSMAVGRDGRIVASGRTNSGSAGSGGGAFGFRADGDVDRGFAGGRGYLTLPEPVEPPEPLGAPAFPRTNISLDSRGRALFLGAEFATERATVTRIDAHGRPDRSFGADGIALLPGYASVSRGDGNGRLRLNLRPTLVTALPGGGALVYARAGRNHEMLYPALIRLTSHGRLDRSFGHQGVAVIVDGLSGGSAILALPGGRILLGGSVRSPCGENAAVSTAALMRLRSDGSPDPSFGHGGVATVSSCAWGRSVSSMALGPGGQIFIAGGTWRRWTPDGPEQSFGVALSVIDRFSAAGRLDRGFGYRAIRSAPPSRRTDLSMAERLIVWQGRILVSGQGGREAFLYSRDGRFERKLAPAGAGESVVGHVLSTAIQDGRPVLVTTTAAKRDLTVEPLVPSASPGRRRTRG